MTSIWVSTSHQEDAYNQFTTVLFRDVSIIKSAATSHVCTTCKDPIHIGSSYVREVLMSRGDEAPTVTKEHLPDCYAAFTLYE